MEDIQIWFGFAVKVFIFLGVSMLLVCIGTGLTFIYHLFKVTLYSMSIAHKYNKLNKMNSELQKVARESELFREINENKQTKNKNNNT